MLLGTLEQVVFPFELCGLHLFQVFFDAFQSLLDLPEIVNDEVKVDVLDIAHRVDGPHVRNRGVLECAHYVRQRIHITQVGGEGRFLQRLLAERRHVGKFHAGVNELLGVVQRGQAVEPIIGNLRDTEMGFA